MEKDFDVFPLVAFFFSILSVIPYIFIFMIEGSASVAMLILLTVLISGTVAVALGFISLVLSEPLKVKRRRMAGTAFFIGLIALFGLFGHIILYM